MKRRTKLHISLKETNRSSPWRREIRTRRTILRESSKRRAAISTTLKMRSKTSRKPCISKILKHLQLSEPSESAEHTTKISSKSRCRRGTQVPGSRSIKPRVRRLKKILTWSRRRQALAKCSMTLSNQKEVSPAGNVMRRRTTTSTSSTRTWLAGRRRRTNRREEARTTRLSRISRQILKIWSLRKCPGLTSTSRRRPKASIRSTACKQAAHWRMALLMKMRFVRRRNASNCSTRESYLVG